MATDHTRYPQFDPAPPSHYLVMAPQTRCRCHKMWVARARVAIAPSAEEPFGVPVNAERHFCCGNCEERYGVDDEGHEVHGLPLPPKSTADAPAAPEPPADPDAPMIKLVDLINSLDDPRARESLVKTLLGVGYQVVAAKAGGFETDVTVTASVRP